MVMVSDLVRISPRARISANVTIGDFTIIHDNVEVHDGTIIDSHCVIGYPTPLAEGNPLVIGKDSLIRSHSVFYEGSRFGDGLKTGHHVTVREKCRAGKFLQLGTYSDVQGHCQIGDHVRTHSGVQINHETVVGNYVWLFPHVVIANDPHPPSNTIRGAVIEDYAAIGTMSCVMPGIRVGTRSLVGAHSLVNKDVEPDTVVGGVPAKKLCMASDIKLKDGSGLPAYPWMRHFHRGYPQELVEAWRREFGSLEDLKQT
jgi:acetyltransferase-like isoleucine patch superfamily enzyme